MRFRYVVVSDPSRHAHVVRKDAMNTTDHLSPDLLCARMVDTIRAQRLVSAAVTDAMLTEYRHLFVPDAPVDEAYAEHAVITKRATTGAALSCASVPSLVATMLDQLQVRPGDRILEIGAGTGWNAALLDHLTGPSGEVTTIDVDHDVTAGARRNLEATGHQRVRVLTRDGALGDDEHAPYDRIIATVGVLDIYDGWWRQLAPGGRIVLPLRWRGQTRSVAFTYTDVRLESDSVELCGFVPMIGHDDERNAPIAAEDAVILYWDQDQPIDPDALNGVLLGTKETVWSGATIGVNESFDGIWLRLTATEPGSCRIATTPSAIASGLATPAIPVRTAAVVEGSSIAYLTLRRLDDAAERRWELGVIAHGPAAAQLAARLCDQIRAWDADRAGQPQITAYPANTPVPADRVIDKTHSRLSIAY
jgi:protein-L-isoaspartate(D-aspartate) O-methyltransferase